MTSPKSRRKAAEPPDLAAPAPVVDPDAPVWSLDLSTWPQQPAWGTQNELELWLGLVERAVAKVARRSYEQFGPGLVRLTAEPAVKPPQVRLQVAYVTLPQLRLQARSAGDRQAIDHITGADHEESYVVELIKEDTVPRRLIAGYRFADQEPPPEPEAVA